jgi:hypothetical protein
MRMRVASSDWCASRSTTSVIPSGVLAFMSFSLRRNGEAR